MVNDDCGDEAGGSAEIMEAASELESIPSGDEWVRDAFRGLVEGGEAGVGEEERWSGCLSYHLQQEGRD